MDTNRRTLTITDGQYVYTVTDRYGNEYSVSYSAPTSNSNADTRLPAGDGYAYIDTHSDIFAAHGYRCPYGYAYSYTVTTDYYTRADTTVNRADILRWYSGQ